MNDDFKLISWSIDPYGEYPLNRNPKDPVECPKCEETFDNWFSYCSTEKHECKRKWIIEQKVVNKKENEDGK